MFVWFVMDKIRVVIRVLLITTFTFYFVVFCVGFIIFVDLPWSSSNELDCWMPGRAIGLRSIRAPKSEACFFPGWFYHTRYKIYLKPNISFHLWIPLIYAPLSHRVCFTYIATIEHSQNHLSHIPQCPIQNRCAYICFERCIVGYRTGALWDLWMWPIFDYAIPKTRKDLSDTVVYWFFGFGLLIVRQVCYTFRLFDFKR